MAGDNVARLHDGAHREFSKAKQNYKPAQGHEIPLSSMIKNAYPAHITLTSGAEVYGVITGFDKWTISLSIGNGRTPVTYFKHSIESFTRDHGE